jgi:ATP-dependent DNA ligase
LLAALRLAIGRGPLALSALGIDTVSRISPQKVSKKHPETRHAFVGGWTQARGKFLRLLLGVREGRRRKLKFVGEVKTPSNQLAMNFLEDQLRTVEAEESPFDGEVPSSGSETRHWTAPELVAEIRFSGWTKSNLLSHPSINGVTPRTAVRHAHWPKPPE